MSLVLISSQQPSSSTAAPQVQSPLPSSRSSKSTHFLHPKMSSTTSNPTKTMFSSRDESAASSTTTGRFSRLSNTTTNNGKSITRSIVMTRYLNAQLEKMQSNLYQKFAQSQNYYYTRDLNDLLGGSRTRFCIEYRDFLVLDEEEEYLKRIYARSEYPGKIKLLTEYYKFHSDIPRLFMLPLCNSINSMYDKKRRIEFFRIAKAIEEENKKNPNKPPKAIVGDVPPTPTEESLMDKKAAGNKKKDEPIDKNLINFLKDISTYINRGQKEPSTQVLQKNQLRSVPIKPTQPPQPAPVSDTLVDINQRLADIIHQSFVSSVSATEINDITANHNLDEFLRFLKTEPEQQASTSSTSSLQQRKPTAASHHNYPEGGKSSIVARNLAQYDYVPKSEGVISSTEQKEAANKIKHQQPQQYSSQQKSSTAGLDLKINLNALGSASNIAQGKSSGYSHRLQTVASLTTNNNSNNNNNLIDFPAAPYSHRSSKADILVDDHTTNNQQQQSRQQSQQQPYPFSSRTTPKEALFQKQAMKSTIALSARSSQSNTPSNADSKLPQQQNLQMKTSTFSQAMNPSFSTPIDHQPSSQNQTPHSQFKITKIKRNSSSTFANNPANHQNQQVPPIESAQNADANGYLTTSKFRQSQPAFDAASYTNNQNSHPQPRMSIKSSSKLTGTLLGTPDSQAFSIQNHPSARGAIPSSTTSKQSKNTITMDSHMYRSLASFNSKSSSISSLAMANSAKLPNPSLSSQNQQQASTGSQTHRPYIQPTQSQLISNQHHRQLSIPFIQNLSQKDSPMAVSSGSASTTNKRNSNASPSATGLNFYTNSMGSSTSVGSTQQSPKIESSTLRNGSSSSSAFANQQNEDYFQKQSMKTMGNGFGQYTLTSPRGGKEDPKKPMIEVKGFHKYTRSEQQTYSSGGLTANGSSSARQIAPNQSNALLTKDYMSAAAFSPTSSLVFEPAAKFRSSVPTQTVKALQVELPQSSNTKNVSPTKKQSLFSK